MRRAGWAASQPPAPCRTDPVRCGSQPAPPNVTIISRAVHNCPQVLQEDRRVVILSITDTGRKKWNTAIIGRQPATNSARRVEAQASKGAMIDWNRAPSHGEVICVDAQGVSQFNQLLSRKGEPGQALPPRPERRRIMPNPIRC